MVTKKQTLADSCITAGKTGDQNMYVGPVLEKQNHCSLPVGDWDSKSFYLRVAGTRRMLTVKYDERDHTHSAIPMIDAKKCQK